MSKIEWKKLVGVAGRVLLAFVFVFSQTAWAVQNQGPKDNAGAPQKATAQQGGERQSTVATNAEAQSEEASGETSESAGAKKRPSGNGSHEGITVHGHWTIEVRNPDGTLVRHVEFENSLDPGFTYPNPTAGQPPLPAPGGAAFLSGIMSGKWSAPGTWEIWLVGPSGITSAFTNTTNAPCATSTGGLLFGACIIAPASFCAGNPSFSSVSGLSCNLSVAPLGTSPAFTGMQFTGSVGANQNGQVGTVLTLATLSCVVTSTPPCLPTGVNAASFTSSTNFPGAPISVIAGQTIAVTVSISFS